MSSHKIKFGDKKVDKKEFYCKIVVSSRWNFNDTTYKYF